MLAQVSLTPAKQVGVVSAWGGKSVRPGSCTSTGFWSNEPRLAEGEAPAARVWHRLTRAEEREREKKYIQIKEKYIYTVRTLQNKLVGTNIFHN